MPPNSVFSVPLRPSRPLRAVGLLAGAAVLLVGTAACSAAATQPSVAPAGAHRQAADSPASGSCHRRATALFGGRVPIAGVRLDVLDEVARSAEAWLYAGAGAPCGSSRLGAVAQPAAKPLLHPAPGPGAGTAAVVPGGMVEQ